MAAPSNKSLQDLKGKWTMSKSLTTPIEGTLKIQGFPSLLRKAVSHAPVYLNVTHPSENELHIEQSTTAGIPAINEEWIFDWAWREKPDKVMGSTKSRSRWIDASDLQNTVKEDFLKAGNWEEVHSGSKLIQAEVEGVDKRWRAIQVWGFEKVNDERRFVRRTLVIDEGGSDDREEVRIVYDWNGE